MPYRVLHSLVDLGPTTGQNASAMGVTYERGAEVPDDALTDAQRERLLEVGAIREIVPGEEEQAAAVGVSIFPTADEDPEDLQRQLDEANTRVEQLEAQIAMAVDADPADQRVNELLKLSKDELVAAAEEAGLATSGTKADLAVRIVAVEFPDEE